MCHYLNWNDQNTVSHPNIHQSEYQCKSQKPVAKPYRLRHIDFPCRHCPEIRIILLLLGSIRCRISQPIIYAILFGLRRPFHMKRAQIERDRGRYPTNKQIANDNHVTSAI